jgi:hypothetical protein
MTDQPRSAFQEAADLPSLTLFQRLLRLQFRRPKQETVAAQGVGDPHTFEPTEEGSGVFGRWIVDAAGLPAYQYEMDQYVDPRAGYPNTENLDRRDHWHQVGNQRMTALASNDGTVEVYMGDRGGVFLNHFDAYQPPGFSLSALFARIAMWIVRTLARLTTPRTPTPPILTAGSQGLVEVEAQAASGKINPRSAPSLEVLDMIAQTGSPDGAVSAQAAVPLSQQYQQAAAAKPVTAANHHYTGGFSFIDDGSETWATAFRYRPKGSETRRVFGIGYYETVMTYRNIRVTRRVYAPYGDTPALLADVKIENLGTSIAHLRHYEYWDVNVHQLKLEWLRSGAFARVVEELRRSINQHFNASIAWEREPNALVFTQELPTPPPARALPPDEPGDTDWSPARIFLADLSGTPDAHYVHRSYFFGEGGVSQPDSVKKRRKGDINSARAEGDPMPFCMILRRNLDLGAGQSLTLRYAYGAIRPEENFAFLDPFRMEDEQPNAFAEMQAAWKEQLAYFYTGQDAVLHREMAWHTYNLLSATVYSAFHQVHLVPQGSAYLYLHGADGAPRDQALFTIPMTYLNPPLAKDMLRLIMRLTDGQTGQISYAFAGHGFLSNALNIHNQPSDLDLFFLLAMCEYLSATGDTAFLKEDVPYYPPEKKDIAPSTTVLDHLRFAVKHIFEGTGIGDHGLLKVGSGDWSDSIVLETSLRDGSGPFGVTYQNSKANGESVMNTEMALYILPLLAALLKDHAPDIVDVVNQHIGGLREAVARQWNAKGWYNRAVLRGIQNNPIVIERLDLEAQPWALISGLARDAGTEERLIEQVDARLDSPSKIGATLVENGMIWPAISQILTWAYAHVSRGDLAWRSLNRNTFAAHATEYPAIWFGTWSGPDGIHGASVEAPNLPGGSWQSPLTPMTDFPVMNANPDGMALLGLLRVCGIEPAPMDDGLVIRPLVPRERFTLDLPLLRLDVEPGRIQGEYRAFNDGERTLYVHVPGKSYPVIIKLAFKAGETVKWVAE